MPTPPPPPPSQPSSDQADLSLDAHKAAIRARIWARLSSVALPDSRFDCDHSSFIADFAGSPAATDRLVSAVAEWRGARTVFIAPDNCLEELRARALEQRKTVLVTSYGIRRGFWVVRPEDVEADGRGVWYAATLDGMEKVGRRVGLGELRAGGWRVDVMVTGTGAVMEGTGVRFGKGHGFFDLEWGMLFSVGAVGEGTVAVGVVHDCQVVGRGEVELRPDAFDTVCDVVVTPTRVLRVEGAVKPKVGILWERLAEGMEGSIPPLRELREMQRREGLESTVGLRGD
ncbi:5-formyltetrahydrofolate cyclo-ligase [Diplodia corticola]|uniref:5-formyltetrahydrofolate cyclo-ligase n=1 Tax=Diplodia corticola TaxID=236234 RepID=A0A1J9RJH2_9PEZI|nr:5-formyltetrahydrofolate cyclo-ligase [Diplodia corticola]OJD32715.1 5-formyltetrahydrofolate cyclo-ligase [Diplodia corticola]